jgi:hypothetical protein
MTITYPLHNKTSATPYTYSNSNNKNVESSALSPPDYPLHPGHPWLGSANPAKEQSALKLSTFKCILSNSDAHTSRKCELLNIGNLKPRRINLNLSLLPIWVLFIMIPPYY